MCFAVMNKLTPASICTLSGGVATFLTLLFPCPRPPAPGHGPGIAPDRGLLTGPRLLCPWEAGLLLSGNTHYHACLPGAKSAKCGPWQLNLWVPLRSNIPSCEDSGCVFCFEHHFSLAVRHSESSLGVPPLLPFSSADPAGAPRLSRSRPRSLPPNPVPQAATLSWLAWLRAARCVYLDEWQGPVGRPSRVLVFLLAFNIVS